MKKIFTVFLVIALIVCSSFAFSEEEPATPTDLVEEVIEPEIEEDVIVEPEQEPDPEPEEEAMVEIIETSNENEIDIEPLKRKLKLSIERHPEFFGDYAIFKLTLIDYPPGEIIKVEWEYSVDNIEWFPVLEPDIDDDNDETTYKFIVTKDNYMFWFRAKLHYQIFDIP